MGVEVGAQEEVCDGCPVVARSRVARFAIRTDKITTFQQLLHEQIQTLQSSTIRGICSLTTSIPPYPDRPI